MTNQRKILVADDEPDILEILRFNLEKEGYEVFTAQNGVDAIELARKHLPDLVILDVMMPHKNGLEVCRTLRSLPAFKDKLIIFLTAAGDDNTEISGLEMGADDYVSKPVSPKVLISRINALFRRAGSNAGQPSMNVGELKIDREKFMVTVKDREITLPRKEFELLALLASRPGKVFLRNEILDKVWGNAVIVGDRTIDVHIRKIRQKLGLDCITTVKGVGYKFEL